MKPQSQLLVILLVVFLKFSPPPSFVKLVRLSASLPYLLVRSALGIHPVDICIDSSVDAPDILAIDRANIKERLNMQSVCRGDNCAIELVSPDISADRAEHLKKYKV